MSTNKNYDAMVAAVERYVRNNGLTEYRIHQYSIIWRGLGHYLQRCCSGEFTVDNGKAYLDNYGLPRKDPPMSAYEKIRVRAVFVLGDYMENGTVRVRRPTLRRGCPWEYEIQSRDFCVYMQRLGLSNNSIHTYSGYIERLFCWLHDHEIAPDETPQLQPLLSYLSAKSSTANSNSGYSHRYNVLLHYLRFISAAEHIKYITNFKPQIAKKLPGIYMEKEIAMIHDKIDTTSSIGKRDVAMFLLVSKLGIRASDVANLRFGNIDWSRALVRLYQVKTGRGLELPLLEDVGQSLIEYLQHGRPISEYDHIFLTFTPPIRPLLSSSISSRFQKMINISQVNQNGSRGYGPHSLRHSLASSLMKHGTNMPVIQSILGHANISTTKKYTRIDIAALKQCTLSVPPPSGKLAALIQEVE